MGGGLSPTVHCLATLPNGDLVAGGEFMTAGGVSAACIARWDGAAWSPLGTGMNAPVMALAPLSNGDLVAGGLFFSAGGGFANYIARWDGTSWAPLGSGMSGGLSLSVLAVTTLPDGDLVAGGNFTIAGGVSASHIARWDGTSWSAIGSGMNGFVRSLAMLPDGDLGVAVNFTTAGNHVSARLARLGTTCPATALTFGAGCSSSVAPLVLAANSLPWVGGTFRSTCTGIAPNGLGFGLFGFTSPGTALSAFHPAAGIGCSLLASPDAVLLLLPAAGSVVNVFGIPRDPAWVGIVLQNQVLEIELSPASSITRVAGSNGITLTIGAF